MAVSLHGELATAMHFSYLYCLIDFPTTHLLLRFLLLSDAHILSVLMPGVMLLDFISCVDILNQPIRDVSFLILFIGIFLYHHKI